MFQTVVSVRVSFLKVGEIDTIKESFTADIQLQVRWREPAFDQQTDIVSHVPPHH